MPEMIFIDSSGLEAIGYDAAARELYVRFLKSGETYIYLDVEQWEFEEFKTADSKGTFFNMNIKNRHDYRK